MEKSPNGILVKGEFSRLTYTVSELCGVLGMSESSVYDALKSGQIPHVKVGGKYLISRVRIAQWLEQKGEQCKIVSIPVMRLMLK